jgi:exonuclease III
MAEPLEMPNPGQEISNSDFVRWVNRAQAIILCLQALKVPVEVADKLHLANDDLISAMRRKIGS